MVGYCPGTPATGAASRVCLVSGWRKPSAPITYLGSTAAEGDGAAITDRRVLETSLCPHAVPLKKAISSAWRSPRCRGSVMLGLGGGADGVGPVPGLGSWNRNERGVRSDRLATHLLRVRRWYLSWPVAARGRVVGSRGQFSTHRTREGSSSLPLGGVWGSLPWSCPQSMPRGYAGRGPQLVSIEFKGRRPRMAPDRANLDRLVGAGSHASQRFSRV